MADEQLIFPKGDKNGAYAQYFIGQSYLANLMSDPALDFHIGQVTFEPACRNNWHIHKSGYQVLLVTAGEGWYQEEGKTAQKIKTGDVIVTHDGIKHWHGATATSSMSHLAITAGEAVWLEPVSDEYYQKLD